MKIAVAGGTGTIGRLTVDAVRELGHEPVIMSRGHGVDLIAGTGLEAALDGADSVIDTVNTNTLAEKASTEFFRTASGNLLAAAARRGIRHVVSLSIVGIDRAPHGYYAGKIAQEHTVEGSSVPWSILRATQFHEFAEQMFRQATLGPLHIAPRARLQPVAGREVAGRLAALAAGEARGRVPDFAGPREEKLDDMVKAFARSIGYRGWVPSMNVPGAQMKSMRAGLVLPGSDAVLGTQTFTEWLVSRG